MSRVGVDDAIGFFDGDTKKLDLMGCACQILDKNLRFQYANDLALSDLKKTRDELIGRELCDLYPGIEDTIVYGRIRNSLYKRKKHTLEQSYRSKDGLIRWSRIIIQPIREGVLVGAYDITQEKKDKLSKSLEERMLDCLPEPVMLVSRAGEITYYNEAAYRSAGYSREEFKAKKIQDILASEQGMPATERLRQAWEAGSAEYETSCLMKDATQYPAQVKALKIIIGGKSQLILTLRDTSLQKQTQQKLADSNNRLKTVLDAIHAFIYVADMQTHELLFVNEYALKTCGKDITGQKCHVALQGLDKPCPFCTNDLLVGEDGKPKGVHRWEFQNKLNKNWYDLRDCAIQWTDERIVRMEIATDITNHKKNQQELQETIQQLRASQQQLRASEQQLKAANQQLRANEQALKASNQKLAESQEKYLNLFNSSRDGLVSTDPQGRFLECNRAYSEMLGYTIEELQSKENFYSITPEKWHRWEKEEIVDKRLLTDGYTGIYEKEYIKKDGTIIQVELQSYAVRKDGEIEYLWGQARDISEKKRIMDALIESESKFRILFDSSADSLFLHDLNGNFITANKTACEMLGYKTEELSSMNASDTGTPWHSTHSPQKLCELQQKESIVFEGAHKTREGKTIPVEINAKIISYGGEKAILSIARDITLRKQLDEQKQKYTRELEAKVDERTKALEAEKNKVEELLQLKTQFINQLSHDLRTPLTPINTLLPIIKQDLTNEESIRQIDMIMRNAKYMNKLITDILNLARLEIPHTTMEKQKTNIKTIIEDAIDSNHTELAKNNMQAQLEADEELPEVTADPLRILEVLNNLTSNAIKYGKTGQKITYKIQKGEGQILISVQDEGQGIQPEHLEKIFDEFYKSDKSRHHIESTGLGLTICKRIIEAHNGKIWAQSDGPGRGTTIKFTLPLTCTPDNGQ
jgi:PAS domain S-box-containing protein